MSLTPSNHSIAPGPALLAVPRFRSPAYRKSTGRPAHQELEP